MMRSSGMDAVDSLNGEVGKTYGQHVWKADLIWKL